MSDYGITNNPDEDTLDVRGQDCAVSVRLHKTVVERVVYDVYWEVQVSNDGADWVTMNAYRDKEDAHLAQLELAQCIESLAGERA